MLHVVLPTARTGLVSAAILGIARACGETAPLMLTIGGAQVTNTNPTHGAQDGLPLFIFTNLRLDTPTAQTRAYMGALVLVTLVLALFTLARLATTRSASEIGRASCRERV